MLDKKGFDKWAGSYDENIAESYKGYPFEGYYDVLSYIQNSIQVNEKTRILDLGIGTGLLTYELYLKGANIVGIDFSEQMLAEAASKMPNATFHCYDFNDEITPEILKGSFDYVVSSYAIHHVDDERKLELVNKLSTCLKDGGKILIADIAFENSGQLEVVKSESDAWDEDEYYIVAETFIPKAERLGYQVKFHQISKCGGVIELVSNQ